MSVAFRNVSGATTDPVATWPYEAIVAALERGTLIDWKPILAEIEAQPWGVVSRQVESYASYADADGTTALMRRWIDHARHERASEERAEVGRRITEYIDLSGLSREQFARAIGTSRSRLSTYASGTVVPSATLMLRMANLSNQEQARR